MYWMRAMLFENRSEAGRELGERLAALQERPREGERRPAAERRPLVFGLVRGGVPVAAEVARALGAPLEALVVRKLRARTNRELAVGAVAEGGVTVLDARLARRTGMTREQLEVVASYEREELERQVAWLRGGREPVSVRGRSAIVVDDGLATGLTELAAVRALRERGAARVVVAVPVGSRRAVRLLETEADAVVCLYVPRELLGVGRWYGDFDEVPEERVRELLESEHEEGA